MAVLAHDTSDCMCSLLQADQKRKKADVSGMYVKCVNLRWLLVDEGSSASCENLGTTESNCRTHIREAPETYKIRPKSRKVSSEVRAWGGLNLLVFVDFWQLPPVRQTAIFHNPYEQTDARVKRIMNMFWNKDEDSMNKMVELTMAKRQDSSQWYFHFIQECRAGAQSEEMYNFVHGQRCSRHA